MSDGRRPSPPTEGGNASRRRDAMLSNFALSGGAEVAHAMSELFEERNRLRAAVKALRRHRVADARLMALVDGDEDEQRAADSKAAGYWQEVVEALAALDGTGITGGGDPDGDAHAGAVASVAGAEGGAPDPRDAVGAEGMAPVDPTSPTYDPDQYGVSGPDACGYCGQDPAAGYAFHGATRYCHGDDDPRPTCYERANWRDAFPEGDETSAGGATDG